MLRRIIAPTFAAAILLTAVSIARAATCDAPAPATAIAPPPASIPKSAAGFAGAWQGEWPVAAHHHVAALCARLYVSIENAATATVEHCTGSQKAAGLKPQCKKYQAQILDGAMSFTDPDGQVYNFTAMDVGGLLAESISADHKSETQFIKME